MRKWLTGLGVVLAIVLVLCFLVVFDVYNQGESIYVAVATFDDVEVNPFLDCPLSRVELRNKRDIPLDLGGWKVGYYGGDLYRIPNKTIVAPGDSIIVSRSVENSVRPLYVESPTQWWLWSHESFMFGTCDNPFR
jgi:hypothetical protein